MSRTSFPSWSCPSIFKSRSWSERCASFRAFSCIRCSCTGFRNQCELSSCFLCQTFCKPPLWFVCKAPSSCSYPLQVKLSYCCSCQLPKKDKHCRPSSVGKRLLQFIMESVVQNEECQLPMF